jgi:NADH:ubiquinone oxidoreductase subunit 5 (subunit L)/multisubunit Na+/H+ antiporter MnhA subunit
VSDHQPVKEADNGRGPVLPAWWRPGQIFILALGVGAITLGVWRLVEGNIGTGCFFLGAGIVMCGAHALGRILWSNPWTGKLAGIILITLGVTALGILDFTGVGLRQDIPRAVLATIAAAGFGRGVLIYWRLYRTAR